MNTLTQSLCSGCFDGGYPVSVQLRSDWTARLRHDECGVSMQSTRYAHTCARDVTAIIWLLSIREIRYTQLAPTVLTCPLRNADAR